MQSKTINKKPAGYIIAGWIFGLVVLAIGVANMVLVHPVPGIVFIILSMVYFPPVNSIMKDQFKISIPMAIKIILGVIIIWFTLGVSDFGDMIDKL